MLKINTKAPNFSLSSTDEKNFTLKEKKNEYTKQYKYEKLDDKVWLKNKKEKSKLYYQNNKDSILKLLEKDLINYRCDDLFLDPEYVAGFFDSDGSVYISNKSMLCVSFTQCVLNILLLLFVELLFLYLISQIE